MLKETEKISVNDKVRAITTIPRRYASSGWTAQVPVGTEGRVVCSHPGSVHVQFKKTENPYEHVLVAITEIQKID